MIFSDTEFNFESEKERNLYYKFFAGYFFNELIPGFDSRLLSFCSLLNRCRRGGRAISSDIIELNPETTHVSFDNHGYLFSGIQIDRGEFADILVQDRSNHLLIPIEAKLHSDWSFDKDIVSNDKRLMLIERKIPNSSVYPCLLLKEAKWKASTDKVSNEDSNYRELKESEDCRTRVIFWEEFSEIVDDKKVIVYLNSQLSRSERGFRYLFHDDWFLQDRQL